MGCDIHSFAEVKKEGKWIKEDKDVFYSGTSEPFDYRDYNMFAVLANVRNSSQVETLNFKEGLPNDSEYLNQISEYHDNMFNQILKPSDVLTKKKEIEECSDYHSLGHIYLSDILKHDYKKEILNARSGSKTTYKEMLDCSVFFEDVDVLKKLGQPNDVRVVFWFDN